MLQSLDYALGVDDTGRRVSCQPALGSCHQLTPSQFWSLLSVLIFMISFVLGRIVGLQYVVIDIYNFTDRKLFNIITGSSFILVKVLVAII